MEQNPTNNSAAFEYLRREAIDAHLAGDGMRAIHACVVALERIVRSNRTKEPLNLKAGSLRWAFFLALYWMLDDWLLYEIMGALKDSPAELLNDNDRKIVDFVRSYLKFPLTQSTVELKSTILRSLSLRSS